MATIHWEADFSGGIFKEGRVMFRPTEISLAELLRAETWMGLVRSHFQGHLG
jgi:hypothetical protein